MYKYLIIFLLLASCNGGTKKAPDEIPPLYPAPQTIALNTEEGYTINSLTGDSIQAILNSLGDTVKTGVPFTVRGKTIHPDSLAAPGKLPAGDPRVIPTRLNLRTIQIDQVLTPLNKDLLETFTPGMDSSSAVLLSSLGDTIPTGVPIPVKGKVVRCLQPQPQKALPLRMKDNAAMNLKYLDVEQGMNLSTVYSILEDSHGNMWFGTHSGGANKYDGVSITQYTQEEGLARTVLSMLEDRDGNLWFGTTEGACMYNGESFIHYTEKEGLSSYPVFSMIEDRHGNLWFGSVGGGVCKFDGDSIIHYTEKEGLCSNDIRSMQEDSNGKLWFGTFGKGVSMYDGETFTHFTGKDGLASYVNCILEDRNRNLWFGAGGEGTTLYKGETFTHFFDLDDPGNNYIQSILEDHHGDIFLGTMGAGVIKYDGQNFTRISIEEGLSNNFVLSMLEDSQGNIWFGTNGGGVSLYQSESFTHIKTKEGLGANRASSILEDRNGNIWLGTDFEGVIMYNGTSFKQYTGEENPGLHFILSGLEDRQENLWFGSSGLGASMYDGKNITHYTEKEGLSDNTINSILEDIGGNIWFATDLGGVCKYNGKTFTHLTEKEGLTNGPVNCILEDTQENIWFGTRRGAFRYNGETLIHISEKEGLSNNIILSIMEDSRGNIWFGTGFGGACMYKGETFTYFTEKEGLASNTVRSILEDHNHNIWLGTEKGLNLLDFGSGEDAKTGQLNHPKIYTFGIQDGLNSMEFENNAALLDRNKRIWWSGNNSLIILDINRFKIPDKAPGIQLKRIEINEQFADFRHLSDNERKEIGFTGVSKFNNYPLNLKLPYNRNHLTFHFSAIDWSAPHQIKYSFQMEGLNENWSPPSSEAKADYRQLPQGSYTFRVRAIGIAQKWSDPLEYTFTITPPFWLSWWAYFIYALLLTFLIFWLKRFEKRRAKMEIDLKLERIQKEKGQELNNMKSKFFTNISHEFRTPLSLIIGPLEDLLINKGTTIEADRGLVEMMKRNAKRLQRLINQLLDISKLESGKMKIKVVEGNLSDYVRTIASAFLSLAESKKIAYRITMPDEKINCVFDSDKVEKILTNLLSNAFKYTPRDGTVVLGMEYLDLKDGAIPQFARIKVSDSGRGIARDQLPLIFDRFSLADAANSREDDSMGVGLALTKELVELLKGRIEVNSEPGKGTEFTVTLPVSAGSYSEAERVEFDLQNDMDAVRENVIVPSNQNKTEILVVEDNEDLRSYIRQKLEAEYTVLEAKNGKEGVSLTRKRIPDLVISDLIMPVMGGMELCRELRNDPRVSHIPIIILTAKAGKRSKLEGLESGADDYIIKPFDAEVLLARVKNLIKQRRNLREVFKMQLLDPVQTSDHPAFEDRLILRLIETIEKNYYNYDFSVNDMCKEMNMSRAQLFRKVNAVTGTTPNELLRHFRINKAARLLEENELNITAIMYEVGFRSTSHFAESFRKYFGKNPSAYRDSYHRRK